jgi:phosphoesterase RecJ-like protein
VEVSLRARPSFDVSTVAVALGGGGHPQASGCTIEGPLDVAVERVVTALKYQISKRTPA